MARNTILANSAAITNVSGTASEALFAGAKLAKQHGLSRTCFMVRLAHLFSSRNETERADFLLGTILSSDIHILKQADDSLQLHKAPIIVAGRRELRIPIAALLRNEPEFLDRVILVRDEEVQDLAGYGALILAKKRGILDHISCNR